MCADPVPLKVVSKINLTSEIDDGEVSSTLRRYPVITAAVRVKRSVGFYWWNIVFPSAIFCLMALGSTFEKERNIADRLSITLTVVLSEC